MVSLHVMRVQEMFLAESQCQRRNAEGEGVNHRATLYIMAFTQCGVLNG